MNSPGETILWPPCPGAPPPLAGNEIHVWAVTLCPSADGLKRFAAILSPDETARAHKFKFERHRNRFIAGRGALREILASYVNANAAELAFDYSPNGKPSLADRFWQMEAGGKHPLLREVEEGARGEEAQHKTPASEIPKSREGFTGGAIHFNLAHSEELALVAVTRVGIIGVDVERVRAVKEMDHLVARFFSPRENNAFQKVPADQKPAAFFNLWSRKEALLKATGEGITRALNLVEVSFLPGEPARFIAIEGDSANAAKWSLRELSPTTGFTGALAIQSREITVRCWKWR